MKFVYAAVLAALGLTQAKKWQPSPRALRNAIPVNKDGSVRKLGDNQQEWEITSDYSIAFQDCVSLTALDEEMFDEGTLQTKFVNGDIVAQKSYIIFKVQGSGNYNANANYNAYNNAASPPDSDELFMVSLDQWYEGLSEIVMQEQEQTEQYCQACEESREVCYPEEDGDDADGNNNGGRKLKKLGGRRRKLEGGQCEIEVDCDSCESAGCFEDEENQNYNNNGNNQEDNECDEEEYVSGCTFGEDALEKFMEDATCSETGLTDYDQNSGEYTELRAGLMCNARGTGVEMAIFLDDDCTIYDKTHSYSELKGTYLYAIAQQAKSIINSPYRNGAISCEKPCEYVALQNEDEYAYNQYNNQADEEEEDAVSEFCEEVFKEALDLTDCDGMVSERAYEYQQQQYNGEQADEEEEDADQAWYGYTFDLAEDADNEEEACLVLNEAGGSFNQFRVFAGSSDYGKTNFFDISGSSSSQKRKLKIAAMSLAALAIVVGGFLVGQWLASGRETKDASKKAPLVKNTDGALA